eukprot:TRINITY_DN12740_c0_g1_i1.p1 TRINITY_DN12740_c0_g1~~TRINITY_DN12740_c0_g1_i1.p1  ORF type:complete len:303 (+),score=44.00 TRINITY_DN12740_c0_g1_i1:73-981(+)
MRPWANGFQRSFVRISPRPRRETLVKGIVSKPQLVPDHIKKPTYFLRSIPDFMEDSIVKNPPSSFAELRTSGHLAGQILKYAASLLRVGLTTDELDKKVHAEIIKHGAYPSPFRYNGFPKSLCTSINECLCHGIPDSRPLQDGDIISLDVTIFLNGYHADCCATFPVGDISEERAKLLDVTQKALHKGISLCGPGVPFNLVGATIEKFAKDNKYSIPPELTGHGVGKEFHMAPYVHHVQNDVKDLMEPGMVFTIEPILVAGPDPALVMWKDDWTIVSEYGYDSAQFEHTILITESGAEILTL